MVVEDCVVVEGSIVLGGPVDNIVVVGGSVDGMVVVGRSVEIVAEGVGSA